jgi:hypothetical protein
VIVPGNRPFAVVGFTIVEGRVTGIDLIADPAKLGSIAGIAE